jgi:hypothetical protein
VFVFLVGVGGKPVLFLQLRFQNVALVPFLGNLGLKPVVLIRFPSED